MLDSQTARWIFVYTIAALISGTAGFIASQNRKLPVSQITLTTVPETPPDQQWSIHLFTSPEKYQTNSENMVLITEQPGPFLDNQDQLPLTRYLCARKPDTWGVVDYRFPLDDSSHVRLAALFANLHVFLEYDPVARGELWIASETTGGQWQLVAALDSVNTETMIHDHIDVTQWVRGSKYLDVRYRVMAHRLMFHPTPNDPIGFAAAQSMRALDIDKYSMRLAVWR